MVSSNTAKIFADKLQDLIASSDLTVKELSIEIGVAVGSLSKYQNNKAEPGADALAKIARYFGVSVDWLLGLSDYRNAEEKQMLEGYLDALRILLSSNIYEQDRKRIMRIIENVITGFRHAYLCDTAYDTYERVLLDVTDGMCTWMQLSEFIITADEKWLSKKEELAIKIGELRFSLTNLILKAVSVADEKLWSRMVEHFPALDAGASWSARPIYDARSIIDKHSVVMKKK